MNDNPAYELFDELGRGENTVVYRAYDLDLGRDVAVKELDAESRKDPRRATQFLKEASFLAQFEHENILRVYSVDRERSWIVMELMKGTLASKIANAPMDAATVRSVMRQILGALDSLHRKGKVHGAVRPSNILINDQGTAKLSDFEATDSDGELRAPTGSKKHLAPELIRPEFGEFGPSLDLYCLGFTVLELLTGPDFESLFPGTGKGAIDADVAWLRWHSSSDALPPVKKLVQRVPDDLANVIDQLISKEVANRPESAQAVLDLLDEQTFIPVAVDEVAQPSPSVDANLPPLKSSIREIDSRPESKPTQKSAKKKKVVAADTRSTKDKLNEFLEKPFVLWPLCAAILIGALMLGLQLQKSDDVETVTPGANPEVTPIVEPIQLANIAFQIEPRDATLLIDNEEQALTSGVPIQLKPGEYQVVVAQDGFDPHRQTLVVTEADQQVRIALRASAPPEPTLARVRLTIEPSPANATVSIDGTQRELQDGTLTLKPGTYQLDVRKDGFEDHTQTLRIDSDDVAVSVSLTPSLSTEPTDVVKILVSMPAEARFLIGEEIFEFPNADAERVEFEVDHRNNQGLTFLAKQDGHYSISRSVDWQTLVAAKFKLNLSLDPLEDVSRHSTSEPIRDPLDTLFVNTQDVSQRHEEKTAELAKQFTGKADLVIDSGGFMSEINDVSFSPDGALIAAGSGKLVRIWSVETGELVATLRGDKSRTSYGNVYTCEFSPDGKTLLVGVNDYKKHGSIREYATADFTEITRLIPGHTAPCRKVTFSGSGNHRVSADSDGNLLIVENDSDQLVGKVRASDPNQPIFDFIQFPDANEDVILAIDAEGPKVFAMDGTMITSPQALPQKFLGWLTDVFGKKVRYPFGHKKDPRVLDFAMERNEWLAADVTRVDGSNKFWAAVFACRKGQAASDSKPIQTYAGHRWRITAVELGPNGRFAASGDKFGEVHVWDRTTGKAVHKFKCQGKSIYEVAFDKNSNRIAFGTRPFKPDQWKRNNYGKATRVLDLRQRAILPLAANDNLRLDNERPSQGALRVDVSKTPQDPSFFVNLKKNSQTLSRYKISSARNPTVYTLIDKPKLGVNVPVVFGDNEGLLALWDTASDKLRRAFVGHGSLVSGVSFSRNGKLMVSASTDRTIQIWSLEDHVPTGSFDFKYENSAVTKVIPGSSSAKAGIREGDKIISMDGLSITEIYQRMLDREFDYRPGQVVPMRMKRNGREFTYDMTMDEGYDFVEPTLSFYVGDDDQWIIWSPTGYYDASPGAEQLIGWHVNRGPAKSAKFYRVQQFRKQLYRPDIIDLILDGKAVADAERIANDERKIPMEPHDLRSVEEIAELHPPEVLIQSPKPQASTKNSTIDFAATVESPNGLSIQEATLLLNGNAIKVFRPTELNSTTLSLRHAIQLSPGENRIEVVASNGRTQSANVGVTVTYRASRNKSQGDVRVLAIGISDYKQRMNSQASLNLAARDAKAFTKAISAHENGKLYDDVHIRLLTNSDATRARILDGFQWLVDRTKPNDSVIIFFSGYGFVDSTENFYLATHEAETERPRATAVSWRELIDMLHEDLPACKRLVFLDAHPTAGGLKPGMRNPLLDLAAPQLGTTFFASNTLQQADARASRSLNGHFPEAILDTLRDSNSDLSPRDQLLNPVELARSIRARVQKATAGRQLPTFFASTEQQRQRNMLELFALDYRAQ